MFTRCHFLMMITSSGKSAGQQELSHFAGSSGNWSHHFRGWSIQLHSSEHFKFMTRKYSSYSPRPTSLIANLSPAQAPSWPSPRSLALQLQLHCCFWPYCVHLFSLHLIFNPEFFYRILPWTHHSDSDLPDRFWKVTTKLWPLASEDRTTVSWLLLWLR